MYDKTPNFEFRRDTTSINILPSVISGSSILESCGNGIRSGELPSV